MAAQEAFESGCVVMGRGTSRQTFGNDALNLVPTRDCVNRSKGARETWPSGQVGLLAERAKG